MNRDVASLDRLLRLTAPSSSDYNDLPGELPGDVSISPQNQGAFMATDTSPTTQPIPQAGAETAEVISTATKGKSNKLLILGLTAMLLLFGVGVGGFWAYSRLIDPPTVSPGRVLPPNTLAYVTMNGSPSESQKKAFDEIRHAFESQPGFSEAWAELTGEASKAFDIDGSSPLSHLLSDFDLLNSYFGSNVTLALLTPATSDLEALRDSSNVAEGKMIDVLKRNIAGLVDLDFNSLNEKGPLADLKRQAEDGAIVDLVEKHRSIQIRRYITDTATLYFSLLTDTSTAVIAADPVPVRAVIDQFVLDEGLKYEPTYKALLADLPSERVATLYVNLTEISRQVRLTRDFPEIAHPLDGQGAWMVALSGKPDGLQINIVAQTEFEGASALLFGKQGIDIEVNPRAKPQVASLYDVPHGSLAFVLGTDLRSMAETALDSFRSEDPRSAAQVEAEIKEKSSLDLRRDILPLLGGDYIGSLSAGGTMDNPAAVIICQLKLSPDSRAKAGEIVPRLIEGASNGSTINETVDAGTRFYSLPASSEFAVALTDDRLIYVQDEHWGEARARAKLVAANAGKGFGGTYQWKAISKHLPVDSNLIGYADVKAIREMSERNMHEEQEREYRQMAPFLRPVRYILVGSANYSNMATKEPKPVSKLRSHTVVFVGIEK